MRDEVQGVTLITLHQVKGLEFGVVFIAGMEEGLLPHSRALEEGDAGIDEERRLTYVGITRARRRLYLLHAFRRHTYGTPQLAEASRFLGEIPGEMLEVAAATRCAVARRYPFVRERFDAPSSATRRGRTPSSSPRSGSARACASVTSAMVRGRCSRAR